MLSYHGCTLLPSFEGVSSAEGRGRKTKTTRRCHIARKIVLIWWWPERPFWFHKHAPGLGKFLVNIARRHSQASIYEFMTQLPIILMDSHSQTDDRLPETDLITPLRSCSKPPQPGQGQKTNLVDPRIRTFHTWYDKDRATATKNPLQFGNPKATQQSLPLRI